MLDNGEEAAGADDVDGLVAVVGIHLPHDAAEVVLDGELRQIQAGGYLLVGQIRAMQSFGGQAASPCATPRTAAMISDAEASFKMYPLTPR